MATPIQNISTEFILLRDTNDKKLLVQWITIPTDWTTWYAKACLFFKTNVASGTSGLYTNVWTDISCVFKLVTNAS